jgi:hypothetical protein
MKTNKAILSLFVYKGCDVKVQFVGVFGVPGDPLK